MVDVNTSHTPEEDAQCPSWPNGLTIIIISLREHGLRQEAGGLLHAEDEVHVLQRLAGGALDQVVDAGQDDGAPGQRVLEHADGAQVRAAHIPRVRDPARVQHLHEGLVLVLLLQKCAQIGGGGIPLQLNVDGGLHAAGHGHEVRGEADPHGAPGRQRQLLLDLGHMPMLAHAVRVDALGDLAVQVGHLRPTAGAAHPGLRVDDDVLRLDEASLQQGDERQLHGGRVASRVGHDTRFLDRLAVELSEAVRHLFLEVQGRVRSTIPLRVFLGVPQPEVRRQVHYLRASW
mmetsp:Transcript_39650/g.66541  ORF Transcript_39650/g.66541 Transcript_39650/m.66541 type:complete len:288 (-) Transcript_39650:546-1409(-)